MGVDIVPVFVGLSQLLHAQSVMDSTSISASLSVSCVGQRPPGQKPQPPDTSPRTKVGQKSPEQKLRNKKPPIMKSTSYLYIGIFAHILDLLCRYYLRANITFEYYFS